MNDNKKTCIRCHKPLALGNFFTSKNKKLHPDGYLNICKSCALMFYEYQNPATFLKVLEEINAPWLPHIYLETLYANFNPSRPNNIATVGKYIQRTKLNQFKEYGYEDSVKAQENCGYLEDEISDPLIYDLPHWDCAPTFTVPLTIESDRMPQGTVDASATENQKIGNTPVLEGIVAGVDTSLLTEEDINYLSTQWGTTTSLSDCIICERKYQEMINNEYEVKGVMHRDYLRKICALSIKADATLANNDYDGYSKLMKTFDQTSKAADLQPKNSSFEESEKYRSIGVIAKICEAEDFIPQWDLDAPIDKVDLTIIDYKLYLKRLISGDKSIQEKMEEVEQKIKNFDNEKTELLEEEERIQEMENYRKYVESYELETEDEE